MKRITEVILMLLFSAVVIFAAAANWYLNPEQSAVSFKIKNFGRNVDGSFKGMKANIQFDEKNPENGSIEASIDVNTINTGNNKRDKDLKSSKYFDATKYPQIGFKAKNISKTDKGYSATGDLTIKDVTRRVTIPFTFNNEGKHGVFQGTLTVNRLDYHVGGKSRILGDIVNVEIKADVNSAPPTTMNIR